MKARDRIVEIEGKSTKDMGLMEAVKIMRGKKGVPLNISIMRRGFDEPRVFTLVRAVIKIKSIKFRSLEDGLRLCAYYAVSKQDRGTILKRP